MGGSRKRNAIHSGIGDHDDLFVKQPQKEDALESFQYAARLRGKKKHEEEIYAEVPFEYGISYKGKTFEKNNEKSYQFGINAHPQKTISYKIAETRELAVKRLWEAKACFSAEVIKNKMQYALDWKGHSGIIDKRTVEYAVDWTGEVVIKNLGDVKDLFTSDKGVYVGYDDNQTTWHLSADGEYVYDGLNRSFFSGVIASDMTSWNAYESEFDFKCILNNKEGLFGKTKRYNWSTGDFYDAPGYDDDVVGLIFQAKDHKNFYMMLWESEERVSGSSRAADNLDGINIFTDQDEYVNRSVVRGENDWSYYSNSMGWGTQHKRIYKITDGVMSRVQAQDLSNGFGWTMFNMHGIKIKTSDKRVEIYVRDSPTSSYIKCFEFDTEWGFGSFGMFNVSQACEFHGISVTQKHLMQGRVPEKGWDSSDLSSKKIVDITESHVTSSSGFRKQCDALNVSYSAPVVLTVQGSVKVAENGSIECGIQKPLVVKANDFSTWKDYGGTLPAAGQWYEFDGIGEENLTNNVQQFIAEKIGVSDFILDEYVAKVKEPKFGTFTVTSKTGAAIAKSNNPADAGEKVSECFVKCGVVEVTPDNKNYNTALVVFEDIVSIFSEDYDDFFSRGDELINRLETYELIKPVKKKKPTPPDSPESEESEAGCSIDDAVVRPPEDEEDECWDDFDFDGQRLVMWSCTFPSKKTELTFEETIFAYQGPKTFNPLASFGQNKWSSYELKPIVSTINPSYDTVKWENQKELKNAPIGSKVVIQTKEWYKATFPADTKNTGIVTTDGDIISELPPCPEHYYHPTKTKERMPDSYTVVHFLLDAWTNNKDVVMWYQSKPDLTTENASTEEDSLAKEGRVGMPLMITSDENDKLVIHCKENPRWYDWNSGKYIGYGKVNGKRPFFGNGSGKADMVNVPTDVVFFPDNIDPKTIDGPFIDVYDKEMPDNSRVKYKLHEDKKRVDFYSDHTDGYVWYSDWHSKWVECEPTYTAVMSKVTPIEDTVQLDPTDTTIAPDYDPDVVTIERIEVTSNNPFVNVWINEVGSNVKGLLGSYYKLSLTANTYEQKWKVDGDYEEWTQTFEIRSYMDKVEVPIDEEKEYKIVKVTVAGAEIASSVTNGWTLEDGVIILHGTAIRAGTLVITYSMGDIGNTFYITEEMGTHIEIYVNGKLLPSSDYGIESRMLTIKKDKLYLHDWVHYQSYEVNDYFNPSQQYHLGEKKYTQLDFQEDSPTKSSNPNYGDLYYEGSFCFNWGYKAPTKLAGTSSAAIASNDFQAMSMYLPEEMQFTFNVDAEVTYPIGKTLDISNFTGIWKQWDQNPLGEAAGDWHGPPEAGYTEVINIRNQGPYSGWYNPSHVDYYDYGFSFKVESRTLWDDDMYGAVFRFDPATMNMYTFEWDAGGAGVNGMAVYKLKCLNPGDAGKAALRFSKTRLGYYKEWWDPTPPSGTDPNRKFYTHEVKIVVIGSHIQVYTDGVLKMDIEDETNPYLHGAWGPITVSNPDTYFWDFWMQTYETATYVEYAPLRVPFKVTAKRKLIEGDQALYEISLDPREMQEVFSKQIEDLCKEKRTTKDQLSAIKYIITNDKSDYSVYFKVDEKKDTFSFDGKAMLYATVKGQYPSVPEKERKDIPYPNEPTIPEMDIPIEDRVNDGFTISWNGYIYAPKTGYYQFRATANDGFRLWIDNKTIIDEWHLTGNPEYFPSYEGSIYLESGKWYPIRANYLDAVGQALVRLHWAKPGDDFERIDPKYLTPYLGYKVLAQVKQARPLPWNPLIHNGYYYHEDREHYLFAQKKIVTATPDDDHKISLSPRPQQGTAIIVRDNKGNNLRKVTFYDDDWNLTLENKETFSGNGYAKYYLNYKGIDKDTLKVYLNGKRLAANEFFFFEESSAIEFMSKIGTDDTIVVKYKLLYSYILDMNPKVSGSRVTSDTAEITLHSNYDSDLMKDMKIIFEAAKETPFYRGTEIVLNPILNHNHTGFLYIAEEGEQTVKQVTVYVSNQTIANAGKENVLVTMQVLDEYGNPCRNKLINLYRDDILIKEKLVTNEAGEAYAYDAPVAAVGAISKYKAVCENVMSEAFLNFYADEKTERYYISLKANKLSVLAKTNDTISIEALLRDPSWNAAAGKSMKLEIRNTSGVMSTKTLTTDENGKAIITVSGLKEQHGDIMIKVSYNMGFEQAMSYLLLKVIGG